MGEKLDIEEQIISRRSDVSGERMGPRKKCYEWKTSVFGETVKQKSRKGLDVHFRCLQDSQTQSYLKLLRMISGQSGQKKQPVLEN